MNINNFIPIFDGVPETTQGVTNSYDYYITGYLIQCDNKAYIIPLDATCTDKLEGIPVILDSVRLHLDNAESRYWSDKGFKHYNDIDVYYVLNKLSVPVNEDYNIVIRWNKQSKLENSTYITTLYGAYSNRLLNILGYYNNDFDRVSDSNGLIKCWKDSNSDNAVWIQFGFGNADSEFFHIEIIDALPIPLPYLKEDNEEKSNKSSINKLDTGVFDLYNKLDTSVFNLYNISTNIQNKIYLNLYSVVWKDCEQREVKTPLVEKVPWAIRNSLLPFMENSEFVKLTRTQGTYSLKYYKIDERHIRIDYGYVDRYFLIEYELSF